MVFLDLQSKHTFKQSNIFAQIRALSDLVEKLKPYFEQLPERKEYQVAEFKL
jgi:hypothetical protein